MQEWPPDLQVEVRRSARRKRTVTAYRDRDTIVVLLPSRMSKADERTFVSDMVGKVLAREARTAPPRTDDDLHARARQLSEAHLAPVLGVAPQPSSVLWVTNQQHRWGSCTPGTGAIRLTHRLQRLPRWVVDYVLIHELVHLVEPNHSDRFWSLVGRYPYAERARGYLEGYATGPAGRGATDTSSDATGDVPTDGPVDDVD